MIINILFYAGLLLFALFQILDVYSTNEFLEQGKKEANPAIRWMIRRFGEYWFIPKLIVATTIAWFIIQVGPGIPAIVALYALVIAWSYAIYINGRAAGWWR